MEQGEFRTFAQLKTGAGTNVLNANLAGSNANKGMYIFYKPVIPFLAL